MNEHSFESKLNHFILEIKDIIPIVQWNVNSNLNFLKGQKFNRNCFEITLLQRFMHNFSMKP